jgi:hypothetical protein
VYIQLWDLSSNTIQYKMPFYSLMFDNIQQGHFHAATQSYLIPLSTSVGFYRGGNLGTYTVPTGKKLLLIASTYKASSCYCTSESIVVQPRSLVSVYNGVFYYAGTGYHAALTSTTRGFLNLPVTAYAADPLQLVNGTQEWCSEEVLNEVFSI